MKRLAISGKARAPRKLKTDAGLLRPSLHTPNPEHKPSEVAKTLYIGRFNGTGNEETSMGVTMACNGYK